MAGDQNKESRGKTLFMWGGWGMESCGLKLLKYTLIRQESGMIIKK